jgi:hypothetical protein
VTVMLVFFQARENRKQNQTNNTQIQQLNLQLQTMQAQLKANQNALLSFNYSLKNDHQELTPYLPFQFNTRYTVIFSEARNLRCDFDILLVDGKPSNEQDRSVSRKFKQAAAGALDTRGQDLGIGTSCWKTVSLPLNDKLICKILSGDKTVYIMSEAKWTNPSGSDGSTDNCGWLQRPTKRQLTMFNIALHACTL